MKTKTIKVEWCKNFIIKQFEKLPYENGGIEINCFWNEAEKAGLWIRGTYGSPMSKALGELTKVKTVCDENGNLLFRTFKLV